MTKNTVTVVACLAFLVCSVSTLSASDKLQETKTSTQSKSSKPVALVGGTIHPVSSDVIENGTIVFVDGKIMAIGADVKVPEDAESIDVTGMHVYPGLFEAHSQLGLTEIGAVPATVDTSETGDLNPNVKANVSINPDSELFPVTRSNGILLAVTSPSSGLVSGQAAVLQLDGWTTEDMTLKAGVAMEVQWPSIRRRRFRASADDDEDEMQKAYQEKIKQLRDLMDETRAYKAGRDADSDSQRLDLRLEAMISVIDGEMPLLVRADTLNQIQDAVAFSIEQKTGLIILGGYDAPLCAELLKKHSVPVIVSAIHRRPLRRSDDYDAAYTLPKRLMDVGVQFCISATDRSETWNTRILPEQAAMAAGFGLSKEDALKSVTLFPAQIMGVDSMVGSLEVGKHATLFVSDGDALEITSHVTHAWVQGKALDLSDRHKRLYEKYTEKYEQLKEDE